MSESSYALDTDPRPGPLAAGVSVVRRHPLAALGVVIVLVALWLGIREGWHELAQATLNGIVAGNYFALGAVGHARRARPQDDEHVLPHAAFVGADALGESSVIGRS